MFVELFQDIPDDAFWITGKRLKLLANTLEKDRARLAVQSGMEIPSPTGRTFLVDGGGSGSGILPWNVTIRNFGSKAAPTWKFIVYKGSRLTKDRRASQTVNVNGLATAFHPASNDTGWTTFSPSGDFFHATRIWIELEYNTDDTAWPAITNASIQYDGGPNSWDGGEAEYINTGTGDAPQYVQSVMRKLIAQVYDPDGHGNFVVDQWVTTHLYLAGSGGDAYDDSAANKQGTALFMAYP